MRPLAALSVAVLAGCYSPQVYCDEVVTVTCARLFECAKTDAERQALASLGFTDEATCVTQQKAQAQCSTRTEQNLCGRAGYVPDKAHACVEEVRALTCEQAAMFRPTCGGPCR